MSLQTNLAGRLRNLKKLPGTQGLMPVFEAVVNSIHSIEENEGPVTDGEITVKIIRNQGSINFQDMPKKRDNDINNFSVIDNGSGFNEANFKSFETLDTDYKIKKGCHGIGRLLWLIAFARAEVKSTYKDSTGKYLDRSFNFDSRNGVHDLLDEESSKKQTGTEITLIDYRDDFKEHSLKTINTIARHLLEHCLWYFVRAEGCPKISIEDSEDRISLHELYKEHMDAITRKEKVEIREHTFDLIHIKFRALAGKKHTMSLCASSRLVNEENIGGKVHGLFDKIADDKGNFVYACYVSSAFLDDRVHPERMSFDIAENMTGNICVNDISLEMIRNEVFNRAREYLQEELLTNIEASKKRIKDFISKKGPRYRPIINRLMVEGVNVDPNEPDKDVELKLHKKLAELESELLDEGHAIVILPSDMNKDDYNKRLKEYMMKADELKKSDLASYVSHRKVIIELLDKAIKANTDGKYSKEDLIHRLIMPMQKDSNEISTDSCNLWLVNERLAFHNYLASDKSIGSMPITGSNSKKEPDLCGLNVYDTPMLVSEEESLPLASITIVEIKRPMLNNMTTSSENDPIKQSLKYLNLIREGKVKTFEGLLIPKSNDIPGYCYVLCDLTSNMTDCCVFAGLRPTADRMGYFGYNEGLKAFIEVISYNQLTKYAKERNRAFFDKLGFPSK